MARRPAAAAPAAVAKQHSRSPSFDCAGILLAGGASRRFPPNKLVELLNDEPLFWSALRALAASTDDIVVMLGATQPEPPLPALSTRVRFGRDRAHGAGPLAAVADALAEIRADAALVVAGDAPHVPAALLGAMRDALANGDADVLALKDGLAVRPMPIAVRPTTAGREAASLVAHGILRLGVLVESAALRLDHREEAWWRRWDPQGDWRRDVDVPADLRGDARGGGAGPR